MMTKPIKQIKSDRMIVSSWRIDSSRAREGIVSWLRALRSYRTLSVCNTGPDDDGHKL